MDYLLERECSRARQAEDMKIEYSAAAKNGGLGKAQIFHRLDGGRGLHVTLYFLFA